MTAQGVNRYDQIFGKIETIWTKYLDTMDESLDILEKELESAEKDSQICTLEWCQSTDAVIADLVHVIYNMHVPNWISNESAARLQEQKKRVHNLYAKFLSLSSPDSIFA